MTDLRTLKDQCEELGIEVVSVQSGGKHLSVRLRAPDGREVNWLAYGGNGARRDWRAEKNNFCRLRRFVRGASPRTGTPAGSRLAY